MQHESAAARPHLATLTGDGGQTILVREERGIPLDLPAAYGTGVQIHVEDLAAQIAGGNAATPTRWNELIPLPVETWRPSSRHWRCRAVVRQTPLNGQRGSTRNEHGSSMRAEVSAHGEMA